MSWTTNVAVVLVLLGGSSLFFYYGGPLLSFEAMDWREVRFRCRRQRVHESCGGRTGGENTSLIIKKRVFFFWDHNASVCTMGKVGSGTWRHHAMVLNHLTPSILKYHDPHDDARRRQLLKQPWESVLKYSMSLSRWISVRHPLTRLVSCYQDKYRNGSNEENLPEYLYDEFLLPALRSNGLLPSQTSGKVKPERTFITFKEFINHVIRSFEGGYVNRHWDTYGRLCSPCFFDYDYITKIETQHEDLDYLFNKFGIPEDPALAVKLRDDQLEKMRRDFSYYKQIPEEMKEKLVKIYKGDMEMFGYQLPHGFL